MWVASINTGDIPNTFDNILHSSKAYKQAPEGRIRPGLEFILPHKVQQTSSNTSNPQIAYVSIEKRHHFRAYSRDCTVFIESDIWRGFSI